MLHGHNHREIGLAGFSFELQRPGAMHFPRSADTCCGGVVIEDAAEVVGHRSLGLSDGSTCQHHDDKDSYCPPKSILLHEKPPNLRFVPLFPEAPRVPGEIRARAGELQAEEWRFGNFALELRLHIQTVQSVPSNGNGPNSSHCPDCRGMPCFAMVGQGMRRYNSA